MSSATSRRRLRIDIFDQHAQEARVLPHLTPPQLIAAILQEFQEVEQLSTSPADYQLVKVVDQLPLDETRPIGEQLRDDDAVRLVEREPALPTGTGRPADAIYLREQGANRVYKLHWLPAIVGRHDSTQADDARVAVDLAAYKSGLRVSRRQVEISAAGDSYAVRSLSPRNPTLLAKADGTVTTLTPEQTPLQPGDGLVLERSGLTFKFLRYLPATANGSAALVDEAVGVGVSRTEPAPSLVVDPMKGAS
jgi:hypothetical protein